MVLCDVDTHLKALSHKLVLGSVDIKTLPLISTEATKYSNRTAQYSGVSQFVPSFILNYAIFPTIEQFVGTK